MNQKDNPNWKNIWDNSESDLVVNYDLIHNYTILRRTEILELFQKNADFKNNNKTFLDLGAGTGAAAFSILQKYKDATAILIDGSIPMLKKAQQKADKEGYNIETIYQDLSDSNWISKCKLNQKYPLIISSIMIHHLTDVEKLRFFTDICSLLTPAGKFIYADVVKMETEEEEMMSIDLWVKEIIQNKISYGIEPKSFEEEKGWIITESKKQEDMPAKITYILNSLHKAGFKKGSMIWFYVKFAMYLAIN